MSAPQPLQHRVPHAQLNATMGVPVPKRGGVSPSPPETPPHPPAVPVCPHCPCPRALLSPTAPRSLPTCPRTRRNARGWSLTHAGGPAGS